MLVICRRRGITETASWRAAEIAHARCDVTFSLAFVSAAVAVMIRVEPRDVSRKFWGWLAY